MPLSLVRPLRPVLLALTVLDQDPFAIRNMFARIAPRYDRANQLLSLRIDRRWRRFVADHLLADPGRVLDVASGTGELSLELRSRRGHEVLSLDFTFEMLVWGGDKPGNDLHAQVCGDALNLPCRSSSFDAACVAFGVRNFSTAGPGLTEMVRVVRNGGTIGVLEFSRPRGLLAPFYEFYFGKIVPILGGFVTGSRSAYEYLHESAGKFPEGEDFLNLLEKAGLEKLTARRLSGGIVTFYRGTKP